MSGLIRSPNALASLSGGFYTPNALSLLGYYSPTSPALSQWQFVRARFTKLLENITITENQRIDGEKKVAGVTACLNAHYWGFSSETANTVLIGSWGKHTRVRPSRDVDLIFLLPNSVYHHFEQRSGNRQSYLLQQVRDVLIQKYSQTARLRGDGQVVVVPFDSTPLEVAPGYRCADGAIITCDTSQGGGYKRSTAEAEAADLNASDVRWNGNTRALARMMKQWQRERNVPLKSFQIERLAVECLSNWAFSHQDVFYYDWMVRDFLSFLLGRANTYLVMPGTGEAVWLGNDWASRAQTAFTHAVSACNNERDKYQVFAGEEWQAIFGSAVPSWTS